MARVWKRAGHFLAACVTLTQGALAQSSAEPLQHSGSTQDGSAPRVLHYHVEPSGPVRDTGTERYKAPATAATAADAGHWAPNTLSPQVTSGFSWVKAAGGYDTAVKGYRARSTAEGALTHYLALRADFEHGPSTAGMDRVSLGTRLQLLDQKKYGIDLGASLAYQPMDFRGEANVIGGLMLGRRFDKLALFANVLVGSDPEGDDQELDGRISAQIRTCRWLQLGWAGRFRYVVTTDPKRFGTDTVDWELALLPNAILMAGPVAFTAEAGYSALRETVSVARPDQQRHLRNGLIAMAGAAAVF